MKDMTYLNWTLDRHSSGTAGSFLKAYSEIGGKKIYYKLSNYDSINGIVGHECVNEIIVDRLLNVLGIEHLSYRLVEAKVKVDGNIWETFLCESDDFKAYKEDKIALDAYYDAEKQDGEKPLDFCIRMGWEKYIYEMLVVDFLILNRDRHGANIEVLRNKAKKTIRLAPLFDHGLSLMFGCYTPESIEAFDIREDKPVQCFVGTQSALSNLSLIPKNKFPKINPLTPDDKEYIIGGLENAVPKQLSDKIWDMLWTRWCIYEDLRNKK